MRQLHRTETIFSTRHAPSWMLLAGSAGMVNAIALSATNVFVTHVTGTATRIGMALAQLWLALELATVLVSFILGAMSASALIDVRAHRGHKPFYALPLFITAGMVASAAALGWLGFFGEFGTNVDQPADFALLSILSFGMGLQNGAVATSTGMVVRTTHLTGPATDLGLGLADLLLVASGERRLSVKRNVLLRTGKIASFVVGAAFAVPLSSSLGYLAFVVPAVAILVANVVSFVDDPAPQPGSREGDAENKGFRAAP